MSARNVFIVSLVGFGTLAGLCVWIIQLARAGEPVAYAVLTGLAAILFLLVSAVVLFMLLWGLGKREQAAFWASARENALVVHQVQRTINDQNKALVEILQQQQQFPSPGQGLAPGGFLIDPAQFDVLDEE